MKADREEGIGTIPIKKHTSRSEPLSYKILSSKEVDFNTKTAIDFLELETFQGEREVRQGHVQFLYDEVVAGRFLWHLVTLASAKLGDKTYRINGQHTSWMRLNLDEKETHSIRSMVYKVDSSDQLRALYSAYDRNAPRTRSHVSKVQLIGSEAAEGVSPSYLGMLVAGYRLFADPDWKRTQSTTDMISIIKDRHSTLFNMVGRFFVLHYEDAIFIRRAAVLASLFATFDKAVKASEEFWEPICSGIGLSDRKDHRWLLRRFIESHSHTIRRGKDVITQEQLHRVCIQVWNHWRNGTPITSIRPVTGEDRPKVKV